MTASPPPPLPCCLLWELCKPHSAPRGCLRCGPEQRAGCNWLGSCPSSPSDSGTCLNSVAPGIQTWMA